ncbi:DUF1877 family protein [Paucibacter sp. PLA-PC-4]|uniref:DUF1877 family protein n=1 Tax=Paucibacter sp. PLA-PC-4 TaxID=2993655 RepID=UPI002248D0F6|nr:DUF1877 family protein [Paucibacter sp. PLA-PC-4]MCX2860941.1 DUF1877 family protein [Paucibacter sp. PLA-PC-4]
MGVCLVAYAVADHHIDQLLADPPLVWRLLEPDDEAVYLREIGFDAQPSLWARLFGKAAVAPPPVPSLSFAEQEMRMLDLDKSWDGINTCLKALEPGAPNFFEDGAPIGAIEVGYGPALCLRSDAMARIAEAYAGVDAAALIEVSQRVNMDDAYLSALWRRQDAESQAYLSENFAELQDFFQHTARHGLGAVVQAT